MGRPIFPRRKNGPAHSFPGEKTDWGEIPACYTGKPPYNAHYDVSNCAKGFIFKLILPLLPYFVYARSQCSGETVHMCRLVGAFNAC